MRLPHIKIFDFFYNLNKEWPFIYNGITQIFSIGMWEKWQDKVFDDLTGKKVLEVGVGPGRLLLRMAKRGFVVTGIETRKGMAYEARRRVKSAGFDVDILHTSVYNMPFKDHEFDAIVMTFVMAEIKQMDEALKEMKRVLKKGGKIIVVAGGIPQDRNIYAQILFKALRYHTDLELDRDNLEYFKKHGFTVERKDFGPFNLVNKIVAVKQ